MSGEMGKFRLRGGLSPLSDLDYFQWVDLIPFSPIRDLVHFQCGLNSFSHFRGSSSFQREEGLSPFCDLGNFKVGLYSIQ